MKHNVMLTIASLLSIVLMTARGLRTRQWGQPR